LWARTAGTVYGALTCGRGPLGAAMDRLERLSRTLGFAHAVVPRSSQPESRRMEQHDAPEV
jgi:hypothetical protein